MDRYGRYLHQPTFAHPIVHTHPPLTMLGYVLIRLFHGLYQPGILPSRHFTCKGKEPFLYPCDTLPPCVVQFVQKTVYSNLFLHGRKAGLGHPKQGRNGHQDPDCQVYCQPNAERGRVGVVGPRHVLCVHFGEPRDGNEGNSDHVEDECDVDEKRSTLLGGNMELAGEANNIESICGAWGYRWV